jgi:diacylglycerol kinase (ATP)
VSATTVVYFRKDSRLFMRGSLLDGPPPPKPLATPEARVRGTLASAVSTLKPVVIVNPRSGGGLSDRRWAALVGPLTDGLGPFETRFTERRGDGRRLALEEASAGRQLVVAFGGDGTISEVVDGLVAAGKTTELGIIPRGTGGDFRRSVCLPEKVAQAAIHVQKAQVHRIDVGRARFVAEDGSPASRCFVNVASFGFSADVATRSNRSSKKMGAHLSFLGATMSSLVRYENIEVRIRVDGGPAQRTTVLMGAVGNGCFFGGGMKICPQGRLDDGILDLVVVGDMGRLRLMTVISSVYQGNHLKLKEVDSQRARTVEVAPADPDARIPIELDGETPGYLPATFDVLPGVLPLRF